MATTRKKVSAVSDGSGSSPRIKLRARGVGTDGAPILALSSNVLSEWTADEESYEAACDIQQTGLFELPGPGPARRKKPLGLVINHTGCNWAPLGDDGNACLLVMEGEGEAVANAVAKSDRWKRIHGELVITADTLVLFDSAVPRGRTRNKVSIPLARGAYLIDELYRSTPFLWLVRLTRTRKGR